MALIPKSKPQKITLVLYVSYMVQKLIYKINFTHTKIHTRQTFIILLHISTCRRCHHQGVRSIANVASSEWFVT